MWFLQQIVYIRKKNDILRAEIRKNMGEIIMFFKRKIQATDHFLHDPFENWDGNILFLFLLIFFF